MLKRFDPGNLRESAKHLEKVVRMDNQIPAAHNNLDACYLRLREYKVCLSQRYGLAAATAA